MNDILVESFTISDLDLISDILESEFDDFWNYNILKNELNNDSSLFLCCKKEKDIIGFAGISIVLDTAELNNIVIKKSERGKGLSSILLRNLIELAKQKGCKKMNLEVSSENMIAIHLYEKFNFKQVGLRQKYYNGKDALLFTLDFYE